MSTTSKEDEVLLQQLRSCQQELLLLKQKLLENGERMERNEIWKKTIENFLSCHLGFDVQLAMKELSSSPSAHSSMITAFDKSPTVGDIVSGRYQYRKSSSSLGIVSSNIHASKSKSDGLPIAIPTHSSHHRSSSSSSNIASQANAKNKSNPLNDKLYTTTRAKYSSSYSATATTTFDQTTGSSTLTGKRKLSAAADDLVWSSTPTFPLSDTAQCAGNLTGDSSPNDNDQDTESENRQDGFSEVKFQEIEDKIREIVPLGSRKSVYECMICGKSLTQRQNARLHIRRVHFLERLKCNGCGRGFYDRRCITNHKAICTKYADWSKQKDFRSTSLSSNPIPIGSMSISNNYGHNQLRSSSSLSDDSPLVDDSENDQETSAGNSWMEKSAQSPSGESGTLVINKDEESRHPVTFIISDDNLTMRKEPQNTTTSNQSIDEDGDLDPSGDGSSSDLFYAPGKLVVVEIVPEMFQFDETNNLH